MALSDLPNEQQQAVYTFLRDYRAALGDLVRSLRSQDLLNVIYNQNVAPVWSQILNSDVIPDGNGLANSGTMTKGDWNVIMAWSSALLDAVYDVGGADAYAWPDSDAVDQFGVLAAGPGNI